MHYEGRRKGNMNEKEKGPAVRGGEEDMNYEREKNRERKERGRWREKREK